TSSTTNLRHHLSDLFPYTTLFRSSPAGINEPVCASKVSNATWRIYVLLPAMFGPVISIMCGRPALARWVSLGTNRSSLKLCSRRSEEHTSELQSQSNLVCRLLLEK